MALSVSRTRVKEKCAITSAAYDSTIDALIEEMVPVIEYAVRDEHLADEGDLGLQRTLELAATEIVCGELLEQLAREQGALECVRVGDLELLRPDRNLWLRVMALKDTGWERLRPFLKSDPSGSKGTVASSRTSKAGSPDLE